MTDEKVEESRLPALSEVISAQFPVPAALATTIPEDQMIVDPGAVGSSTFTVPENSRIVVPVLPECIPLIARVPDVVCTDPAQSTDESKEVVKISQVLPGYAPSYAGDYIPEEVNNQSFNSFVNTMSFNVSRYPTLSEVTASKDYSKDAKRSKPSTSADKPTSTTNTITTQKLDYIPAEYFTGQGSLQPSLHAGGCVMSQSIRMVPPDVLSSGRVMTNMSTNAIKYYTAGTEAGGENTVAEATAAVANTSTVAATATAPSLSANGDASATDLTPSSTATTTAPAATD